MNILIACEFSGRVRDAFRARGHNAWSCDLLPNESKYHFEGDVREAIQRRVWDMMIVFPPCTHLAVSGARWFWYKRQAQTKAIKFIRRLMNAPIDKICLENPIGIISTRIRKPDQIIQPWQFGHGEVKSTCLWLKGLPKLKPTRIVKGREPRVWKMGPSPDRAKKRSITYLGIAKAMAKQWG